MMVIENGTVGAVAIGRNEEARLADSLSSLKAYVDGPIVYVDSGSTDSSRAIAEEMEVQIVDLDMSLPFSASRARNVGFDALIQKRCIEFVQFVDGDCVLFDGWINAAHDYLLRHPEVAAVCGKRVEQYPNASPYNQLLNIEWDTPVGSASATGGDFLIRASCFQEVGGFNVSVIAGEEPELGFRLRQKGWKLARIDHDMTIHDAQMYRFSQWWLREVRTGYGALDVFQRTSLDKQSYFRRIVWSARTWAAVWISVIACSLVLLFAIKSWLLSVLPVGLGITLTLGKAFAISTHYERPTIGKSRAFRLATLILLGKLPQLIGQCRWVVDRISGRSAQVIEYRAATQDARSLLTPGGDRRA